VDITIKVQMAGRASVAEVLYPSRFEGNRERRKDTGWHAVPRCRDIFFIPVLQDAMQYARAYSLSPGVWPVMFQSCSNKSDMGTCDVQMVVERPTDRYAMYA